MSFNKGMTEHAPPIGSGGIMLTKRIIPCLDVKGGRTVKGTNFINLQDAGCPVELAGRYSEDGADEIVFLDISATEERRKTLFDLVEKVARKLKIPFTVGGGISNIRDVGELLERGADKVSINSAAVRNPSLVDELSRNFGSQCIVVAVDSRLSDGKQTVFIEGGRIDSGLEATEWARELAERGAGEILMTSIDRDGSGKGFDLPLISKLAEILPVPVIASGGAGSSEDFRRVFAEASADAALAAGVFHRGEIRISELKRELCERGIRVRI